MPYTPNTTFAVNAVAARLRADATLAALLTGGIVTRPIVREAGVPATYLDADKRLKPVAYLSDGGEGPGQNFSDHPNAYQAYVHVYILVNADEERKDIARQAKSRIRKLLMVDNPDGAPPAAGERDPWTWVNDTGRLMFPNRLVSDLGDYDSEMFIGAREFHLRFSFDGQRAY